GTEVIAKADASPVTEADRGAEEAMRRLIETRYPDHAILGEEFGARDGRGYRWVLDPVDGTRAFISNCFLFGTLIALERATAQGFRPLLGAIAHPAANVAVIGGGDLCTLYAPDGSSRPARVRSCARLEDATVLATSHWGSGEQDGPAAVERLARRAKLYRTWGDCFGYFALATGGADLMLDPVLAYWDVAAIVPVVEAAGGRITAWSGGDPLAQPSAVASAGPLHDEALALLHAGGAPTPDRCA
ncbi:MAG: inositol monophosphatase, partial [Burkholderiaceae bacterium]|nr:inositol monophosphatase [Burkholderiaceae bacterium]